MKRRINLVVMGLYLFVNLIVFKVYWNQIFHDDSKEGAVYAEVLTWEWGVEQVYQNIKSGKSPFSSTEYALYPFGADLTSVDAGNAIFFPLLRPFLSTHQTISIIVAVSIIAANFGMYLLLLSIGVRRGISIIIGFAFGYMTFLQSRAGHLTYMSIYVFPWFYWSIVSLFKSMGELKKIYFAVLAALFFALALYHNLYYFVMLGWSILFFGIFYLITQISLISQFLKLNWRYLCVFCVALSLFLSPWLLAVRNNSMFDGLPKTSGWGGAIEYSSDLFGFFLPGPYSKFFAKPTGMVGNVFSFARDRFENFTYPGLIILIGYVMIVLCYLNNRRNRCVIKNHPSLVAYLFVALCFGTLSLGPFLHVLGKWGISLEGVRVMIPLPYLLFHYVPFMANIRSPGRLVVGLIFFSYIGVGIFLSNWLKIKRKLFITVVYFLSGCILFLDHSFIYTKALPSVKPDKIYEYIRNDPDYFSVYEIPSVVRDGFRYFGSADSVKTVVGQLIYDKPILAGYFGRVSSYKREYYQNNPFLGYWGRLMDQGVEHNGSLDRTELPKWQNIDLAASEDAIDFLDLKYVILDMNEPYAATSTPTLSKLQFTRVMDDVNYSLWKRELNQNEFLDVLVGQPGDEIYLGIGWRGRDNGFRWADKTSSFMFNVAEQRDYKLIITGASYYKPQMAKIYLNQFEIAKVNFSTNVEQHEINIVSPQIEKGINVFYIRFSNAYQPYKVEPENLDYSMIAGKFVEIKLEK